MFSFFFRIVFERYSCCVHFSKFLSKFWSRNLVLVGSLFFCGFFACRFVWGECTMDRVFLLRLLGLFIILVWRLTYGCVIIMIYGARFPLIISIFFLLWRECVFVNLFFPCRLQARPLSKSFQRGEDAQFDQLTSCFHAVAEHALPSLLRTLFAWHDRQNVDYSHLNPPAVEPSNKASKADTSKSGSGSTKSTLELLEKEHLMLKRNLSVDYLFALLLIEILKQVRGSTRMFFASSHIA